MHPVFKTRRKHYVARCAYLYRDGHVVVGFDHERNASKRVWQIAESIGLESVSIDTGIGSEDHSHESRTRPARLVFHQPLLLAAMASLRKPHISAAVAADRRGSHNTQQAGIPVGYVSVHSGWQYGAGFTIHDIPNMISGPVLVQADFLGQPVHEEKWDEIKCAKLYGDEEIVAVFDRKGKA